MSQRFQVEKLWVHHVGGRLPTIPGQGFPLPIPKQLAREMAVVLYEGDESCIDQIYNTNRESGIDLRVISGVVAGRNGPAKFHLTHDAYGSSLLPLNEKYEGMYMFSNTYADYLPKESGRTVRTIDVQASTIDHLVAVHGMAMDFFSTDAEGADFDVLRGASSALRDKAVGFYTETQLIEFRKGAKHFGHIIDLADELGYRVVRWEPQGDVKYHRGPLGWRAAGSSAYGDALFLKDIGELAESGPGARARLRKLAFVAICFDQLEYALEAMRAADQLTEAGPNEMAGLPYYLSLIDRIWTVYKNQTHLMPTTFLDCFDYESAIARNSANVSEITVKHSIRAARERYLSRVDPKTLVAAIESLSNSGYSPLELLLQEAGFFRLSSTVRENRLQQLYVFLRSIGLGASHEGRQIADLNWIKRELL